MSPALIYVILMGSLLPPNPKLLHRPEEVRQQARKSSFSGKIVNGRLHVPEAGNRGGNDKTEGAAAAAAEQAKQPAQTRRSLREGLMGLFGVGGEEAWAGSEGRAGVGAAGGGSCPTTGSGRYPFGMGTWQARVQAAAVCSAAMH